MEQEGGPAMTREEAIAILKESKRQNEIMRDNPNTFWASHQMADGVKNTKKRIAALDFALTALRDGRGCGDGDGEDGRITK